MPVGLYAGVDRVPWTRIRSIWQKEPELPPPCTERMTEHYSHVDVGEKRAAMEGVLRLVHVGAAGPANTTTEHEQAGPKQALN